MRGAGKSNPSNCEEKKRKKKEGKGVRKGV